MPVEAANISFNINSLWKNINPTILPPTIGK